MNRFRSSWGGGQSCGMFAAGTDGRGISLFVYFKSSPWMDQSTIKRYQWKSDVRFRDAVIVPGSHRQRMEYSTALSESKTHLKRGLMNR